MTRERLPNRRPSEVVEFDHDGIRYRGSVSWGLPGCEPREVFLDGGRVGSAVHGASRDSAVAVSLALQHGAPLQAIRAALTRNEDGSPAGPLGALLDLVEGA